MWRDTVCIGKVIAAVEGSHKKDWNESIQRLKLYRFTLWKILQKDLCLQDPVYANHVTIKRAECTVNGPKTRFNAKFSLAMRLIFGRTTMSISRLVKFGMEKSVSLYIKSHRLVCFLDRWTYFFNNDASQNVTDNGERYKAMIANFFVPQLNDIDGA